MISRPCDELAVALYMSDMPDRQPKGDTWTLAQLAAWVRDGIATLGGTAETWRTAYRMRPAAEIANWLEYRLFWTTPPGEDRTPRGRPAHQVTRIHLQAPRGPGGDRHQPHRRIGVPASRSTCETSGSPPSWGW